MKKKKRGKNIHKIEPICFPLSLSLLSFKIKESHEAKRSDQKYLELGFPSIPQTISKHLHNLNQGVRLVSPGGPVFDFATYVLQVCPPFIPTQKSR